MNDITMPRTRCPSCICGFDSITERVGIPTTKEVKNMTLVSFLDCMENLGVTHSPLDGIQEIVLGGNLSDICQQKRAVFIRKLADNRVTIARILSQNLIEKVGC